MEAPLATYTLYDGSQYSVLERPATPDGPLLMRWRLPSGGTEPPPHLHPFTVERYEVLEGEFEVMVGKKWRTLRMGESAAVNPGVRHSFRNRSGGDVVVRNVHEPHYGFEDYICAVAQLTQRTRAIAPNRPGVAVRFAVLMGSHRDLIRLTDLPLSFAVPALGRIGRLLRISPA